MLLKMFCSSSSRCCGLVCSVWLWYLLSILTYFLSLLDYPTLFHWVSPFLCLELFAGYFFMLNLNRTFCRQTVETQIRRNFLKSSLSAYVTQKDVSLIWVNHNNKQCINNSRTTAIEWAAVKATAGREAEIKDVFGPRWIWLKFKYMVVWSFSFLHEHVFELTTVYAVTWNKVSH